MTSGHDPTRDLNQRPLASEPIEPPEKPLERNIPTSSFPEPSLSSTVMETSAESNDVRPEKAHEDMYATRPRQRQSVTREEIKDKKESSPESVVKGQGLGREKTEVLRELEAKPEEPTRVKASRAAIPEGISEDVSKGSPERIESDVVIPRQSETEKHAPPILDANELEQAEQSDDDESLDLSDLSLPDGNEPYVPSVLQGDRRLSREQAEERSGHKDPDVSAEPSKPNIVPERSKSFTEEISEEIVETAPLDDSEGHDDLVHDEGSKILPKNDAEISFSDSPKAQDVRNDEDEKEKVTRENVLEPEAERDVRESLLKDGSGRTPQKAEEDKKPSVDVDGFLALLQTVDADVEVSFSPEALYRSAQCSLDLRQEITR